MTRLLVVTIGRREGGSRRGELETDSTRRGQNEWTCHYLLFLAEAFVS